MKYTAEFDILSSVGYGTLMGDLPPGRQLRSRRPCCPTEVNERWCRRQFCLPLHSLNQSEVVIVRRWMERPRHTPVRPRGHVSFVSVATYALVFPHVGSAQFFVGFFREMWLQQAYEFLAKFVIELQVKILNVRNLWPHRTNFCFRFRMGNTAVCGRGRSLPSLSFLHIHPRLFSFRRREFADRIVAAEDENWLGHSRALQHAQQSTAIPGWLICFSYLKF